MPLTSSPLDDLWGTLQRLLSNTGGTPNAVRSTWGLASDILTAQHGPHKTSAVDSELRLWAKIVLNNGGTPTATDSMLGMMQNALKTQGGTRKPSAKDSELNTGYKLVNNGLPA